MFLGLDGCKSGWVAAQINDNGVLEIKIISDLSRLEKMTNVESVLIDIPIGFPDNTYRQCDLDARNFLRPKRHNSVFFTPSKEAVFANSYEDACKINYEKMGKKISKQSWSICKKIIEVYEYIKCPGHLPIRESHPEICFWGINGYPCKHNKKTKDGIEERLGIISKINPDYSKTILKTKESIKNKDAMPDDIIDATILAIVASKRNFLSVIPSIDDYDKEGLKREFVYYKEDLRHFA